MPRRLVDIATQHTADFISSHAPKGGAVLEIGCGQGDLAQVLETSGFKVTAIDGDKDAIVAARARGVNAANATWPTYQSDKVDAILFTRSLHHMHELDAAISAARARLTGHGVLLIEDFAFDKADARTINWFVAKLKSDRFARRLSPPRDSFVANILRANDPKAAWRHDHDHDLHTIEAMQTAVAAQFGQSSTHTAPYLYRYLIPALPESDEAVILVEDFLSQEKDMIASGGITPIGRRIIASP